MAYVRKTKDVYRLLCDYGYGDGYECILEEDNLREAKKRKREYEENAPQYSYKIKKVRERI